MESMAKTTVFPPDAERAGNLVDCRLLFVVVDQLLFHLKDFIRRVPHASADAYGAVVPKVPAGSLRCIIGTPYVENRTFRADVEVVDRFHKADAANLKEVVHIFPAVREFLNHGQNKPQIAPISVPPAPSDRPVSSVSGARRFRRFSTP